MHIVPYDGGAGASTGFKVQFYRIPEGSDAAAARLRHVWAENTILTGIAANVYRSSESDTLSRRYIVSVLSSNRLEYAEERAPEVRDHVCTFIRDPIPQLGGRWFAGWTAKQAKGGTVSDTPGIESTWSVELRPRLDGNYLCVANDGVQTRSRGLIRRLAGGAWQWESNTELHRPNEREATLPTGNLPTGEPKTDATVEPSPDAPFSATPPVRTGDVLTIVWRVPGNEASIIMMKVPDLAGFWSARSREFGSPSWGLREDILHVQHVHADITSWAPSQLRPHHDALKYRVRIVDSATIQRPVYDLVPASMTGPRYGGYVHRDNIGLWTLNGYEAQADYWAPGRSMRDQLSTLISNATADEITWKVPLPIIGSPEWDNNRDRRPDVMWRRIGKEECLDLTGDWAAVIPDSRSGRMYPLFVTFRKLEAGRDGCIWEGTVRNPGHAGRASYVGAPPRLTVVRLISAGASNQYYWRRSDAGLHDRRKTRHGNEHDPPVVERSYATITGYGGVALSILKNGPENSETWVRHYSPMPTKSVHALQDGARMSGIQPNPVFRTPQECWNECVKTPGCKSAAFRWLPWDPTGATQAPANPGDADYVIGKECVLRNTEDGVEYDANDTDWGLMVKPAWIDISGEWTLNGVTGWASGPLDGSYPPSWTFGVGNDIWTLTPTIFVNRYTASTQGTTSFYSHTVRVDEGWVMHWFDLNHARPRYDPNAPEYTSMQAQAVWTRKDKPRFRTLPDPSASPAPPAPAPR